MRVEDFRIMHHLLSAFATPGSPARLGSHAPRFVALGEPLRAPGGLGGYKAASGIGAYHGSKVPLALPRACPDTRYLAPEMCIAGPNGKWFL